MKLIETVAELEEALSRPTPRLVETLRGLEGDILLLGAGGKMGPSLARMARRALDEVGGRRRVIAASRFSAPAAATSLQACGVDVVRCDLFDASALDRLPDAANVVFMAGQKFGTSDDPGSTWATNTLLPARVAERFRRSRIVAFSTGNVYSLVDASGPGSREDAPLSPPGEYAQSCLARERIFSHFSRRHGTPVLLLRLNYAIDLRYGVLLDVAQKVARGEPVDVSMGWLNCTWQGDANARALECLAHTTSPPQALNVTGRERVSVRWLAGQFGRLLDREPLLIGLEAATAWLADASRSFELLGPTSVTLEEMIELTAHWVKRGGATLGKPTHFEVRDGQF